MPTGCRSVYLLVISKVVPKICARMNSMLGGFFSSYGQMVLRDCAGRGPWRSVRGKRGAQGVLSSEVTLDTRRRSSGVVETSRPLAVTVVNRLAVLLCKAALGIGINTAGIDERFPSLPADDDRSTASFRFPAAARCSRQDRAQKIPAKPK